MEPKDPNPGDDLQPNSAAEDFFSKMNRDFRRPKPSDEAVAAALQAIQALAQDSVLENQSSEIVPVTPASQTGTQCPKCGGENSGTNRFCGFCGATLNKPPTEGVKPGAVGPNAGEQHVYHHHYHHHYFPSKPVPADVSSGQGSATGESLSAGETPPQGTDFELRKVVEDWVRACNGKRVEDLAVLYADDGLVIRASAPIARGRAAITELLQAEIQQGLGDVMLDCTDIGTLGQVACLSGVSRMLLPVAPANRRERTGKFLMVVRREGPDWKILADAWCLDAQQPVPTASKPRN